MDSARRIVKLLWPAGAILAIAGAYFSLYASAERELARCTGQAIEKLSSQRSPTLVSFPSIPELDYAYSCMVAKGFEFDEEGAKRDGREGIMLLGEYRYGWEGKAKYWRRKF